MLHYTGHPLIDIGTAAVTVYCRRTRPEALTSADLTTVATLLEGLYSQQGPMQRHIKGMVLLNPGYGTGDGAFAARALWSWPPGSPLLGETCAFCGGPAAYRANREYVPLLNGRDVFNFGPAGRAGVPICGRCSLAVQALPLGCLKSSGVLIAAHSDDAALMQALVAHAQRRILAALSLADGEVPVAPHARTRLVALLLEWIQHTERLAVGGTGHHSLTGYLFSNYGPEPKLRIVRLGAHVLAFLRLAAHHPEPGLSEAWERAVQRSWLATPVKRKAAQGASADARTSPDDHESMRANRLYESLLDLPGSARLILRRDLFPTRHWGLVALYLRKVMGMDAGRIALLKRLGERFATYSQDRRAFFFEFLRTQEYATWRRAIIRAADDCVRRQGLTLITMDEFVEAFTAPDGEINDWKLARDLVGLAMIDARQQAGEVLAEPLFEDEGVPLGIRQVDVPEGDAQFDNQL
jgi:CRISPR-associated protein Cas8b1/Cst1 subtype I-B